ncbi:hypothetical protein UR09_01695 [Candidatus Nitromaritima sp. SCGC AAA799-A02]|nr:hypothetical protein UR09_01695 [Candidatus Nitromaritima sp. SCGC AAA799-A02]
MLADTFFARKMTPLYFQAGILTRGHPTLYTFPAKHQWFYVDFVTLTAAGPWLNLTTFPFIPRRSLKNFQKPISILKKLQEIFDLVPKF